MNRAAISLTTGTLLAVLSLVTPSLMGQPSPGAPSADTAVVGAGEQSRVGDQEPPPAHGSDVSITLDWDRPVLKIPTGLFSVAGFRAGDPDTASQPKYQAGLETMGIRALRYHTAESMMDVRKSPNAWLDHEKRTWASERIVAAVSAWNPPEVRKVVNIVGWPSWMDADGDGYLDNDQFDRFAEFCAELVRILNVDAKLGITDFEVTNEKDGLYWIDPARENKPLRIKDLADIYRRAARAMKQVDPSIRVGGPSAMRPDQNEPLLLWVREVLPDLDFLSVHMYASGNPKDPDSHIWDRTESFGKAAAELRKALDAISPNRHIELHVNEFNISWTWETRDVRMTNQVGAVFDALALTAFARAGVDMANAWNECDGIYGKMDGDFALRPSAWVFHLFNNSLTGTLVESASTKPRWVEALAVVDQSNARRLLLINRSDKDRNVNLGSEPLFTAMKRVDAKGLLDVAPPTTTSFELPPTSVTLLMDSPSQP